MEVRGDGAAQVALEVAVVQPAQERLGHEEDEHHDADDGVVVVIWVRELTIRLLANTYASVTRTSSTAHVSLSATALRFERKVKQDK